MLVKFTTLSRFYILKRVFAKILVILFTNIYFKKLVTLLGLQNSKLFDVEGIFFILGVERELENLILVNAIINKFQISKYVDIGTNFGQFASGVNIDNTQKILVEPNKNLWPTIIGLNEGAKLYKVGLLPDQSSKKVLAIKSGNTGISMYIDETDISCEQEIMQTKTMSVKDFYKDLKITENELYLFKIDVEGLESELLKELVKNAKKQKHIYAFEVLNREEVTKAKSFMDDYEMYSVRYNYQGTGDRNFNSIASIVGVLLSGKDELILEKLVLNSYSRDFYSLVFCIPKDMCVELLMDEI